MAKLKHEAMASEWLDLHNPFPRVHPRVSLVGSWKRLDPRERDRRRAKIGLPREEVLT